MKETNAGWLKYEGNPVLGGDLGTCFDIGVIKEENMYQMYFSWRPRKSIALVESIDGINWSEPQIVLAPSNEIDWEEDLNRPVVVKREDEYFMWYTGQINAGDNENGKSRIGFAKSQDGVNWVRVSDKPVLIAEEPWEKTSVMCPHVIWDSEENVFKMWYSAGEQYEPNAIGYAVSADGLNWEKSNLNPVFTADKDKAWEQHKVAGCQVIKMDNWYYMFYIGYYDEHRAQIGVARSRNGLGDWQRHEENPLIYPGEETWDGEACYKPYAIFDGEKWFLWYNGRKGHLEQIGLAIHQGKNLGF